MRVVSGGRMDHPEIAAAITKGISDSMPWPTEIGTAIYHGTKDAKQ